jgi:chaperonin GroES
VLIDEETGSLGRPWKLGHAPGCQPVERHQQTVIGSGHGRALRDAEPAPATWFGGGRPSQEECTLAKATASTKLRPLGDRVVLIPTAREEMTKSGIVLPDTAKEKPQEGSILAVGPGRILDDGTREAMDVKVGQKVLYGKYAGTEFKVDGDELLIVSQKDILAIVAD